MKTQAIRCEIFCRVIDNYGDAAVCWRLAKQLAIEHGWQVSLWIDNLKPLQQLAPDYANGPVKILEWPGDETTHHESQVVIEAFGCNLPESKVSLMASQQPKPVWINLEYLSAEDWVAGCHGLDSPHPRLPLVKQFFFPGFDEKTGGLLRERNYRQRQQAFDPAAFRAEFGVPPPLANELTISLFSYPNPALPSLMQAWAASDRPIRLLLPGSDHPTQTQGKLHLHPLPFLPQPRYDELLWACDLNFVRGEDSFVRALWAAKPFVWHIYPQDESVHLAKLDAFLARYSTNAALRDFWHAWNGNGRIEWKQFASTLPAQITNAKEWTETLSSRPDLAARLVQFCLERIK